MMVMMMMMTLHVYHHQPDVLFQNSHGATEINKQTIRIVKVIAEIRKEHPLDANQKRCHASRIHNSYAIPVDRICTVLEYSLISKQFVSSILIPNQNMLENQTRSETELLLSVWVEVYILLSIQLCSTKFAAL